MNYYFKKIIKMIIAVVILVSIDQITKYMAVEFLTNNSIDIIPGFFKLELLYNNGAAFGILSNSRLFFCILTVILCVIIEYVYIKTPANKKYIFLNIILLVFLSGAIGNLIDRIKTGLVVDFLSFKFGSYYFPTFNVADIYVTVSAIVLLLLLFFYYKDEDLAFISPIKHND